VSELTSTMADWKASLGKDTAEAAAKTHASQRFLSVVSHVMISINDISLMQRLLSAVLLSAV
jgi:hypothetical protein